MKHPDPRLVRAALAVAVMLAILLAGFVGPAYWLWTH